MYLICRRHDILLVACAEYAVTASRSAADDFAERSSHQDLGGSGALQN